MITTDRIINRLIPDTIRVAEALKSMPAKKPELSTAHVIALTPITRPAGPARILYDHAYMHDLPITPLAQQLFNHKGIIPAGVTDETPRIRNMIETTDMGEVISPPIVEIFRAQDPTASPADHITQ